MQKQLKERHKEEVVERIKADETFELCEKKRKLEIEKIKKAPCVLIKEDPPLPKELFTKERAVKDSRKLSQDIK